MPDSPTVTSVFPGAKALIMGPPGTGKTTSLKTLLDIPDLEVFAIFTEPRYDILGADVLNRIHWRYVSPGATGWAAILDAANKVNTLSNDSLQKITNISAGKYTQYIDVINLCNDFVDQHGVSFGDVSTWGTNRVLWFDGLSGLSKMARKLRAGGKPILTQPDWGVSMTMIQEAIDALVTSLYCHFILVTHIERETDEVTGASRMMVSTLGRKLAPMIPLNFGDLILAKKEGTDFSWSTADSGADLKNGFLPLNSKIKPSFAPWIKEWQAKGGILGATPPPNWQSGTNDK